MRGDIIVFNRACCIKNCKSASFLICISTDSEYFSASGFQIDASESRHLIGRQILLGNTGINSKTLLIIGQTSNYRSRIVFELQKKVIDGVLFDFG